MNKAKSLLKNALINNQSTLYNVIVEYNMYDGQSFVAFNNKEGLDELFNGFSEQEIIQKCLGGSYNCTDEFVKFDDNGMVKSFNRLEDEIDIDKVIEWLYSNNDTEGAWESIRIDKIIEEEEPPTPKTYRFLTTNIEYGYIDVVATNIDDARDKAYGLNGDYFVHNSEVSDISFEEIVK